MARKLYTVAISAYSTPSLLTVKGSTIYTQNVTVQALAIYEADDAACRVRAMQIALENFPQALGYTSHTIASLVEVPPSFILEVAVELLKENL